MDKDLLIAAVFQRNPIWDKKHKLHCNRNVVNKFWKEISAEMKEDEAEVRKQWKYLRDQFAVELGKYPPPRSGDSAEDVPTSKWPYFGQLLFLKDIIKPRDMTGNLTKSSNKFHQNANQQEIQPLNEHSSRDNEASSCNQEPSQAPSSDNEDRNEEVTKTVANNRNEERNLESCTSTKTTSAPLPKKRRATDTFNESILSIERRKVEYLEGKATKYNLSSQDDEHLAFFKSLLSHVKKIPENKILNFRCRVQELVSQFAYESNSSSVSATTTSRTPSVYSTNQRSHNVFYSRPPSTATSSSNLLPIYNTNLDESSQSSWYSRPPSTASYYSTASPLHNPFDRRNENQQTTLYEYNQNDDFQSTFKG